MEDLKKIKEKLICIIMEQLNKDLGSVSAKELGEVTDMLKDISETIYYHTVVESMDNSAQLVKEKYMDKYIPEYKSRMYFKEEETESV